MPGQQPQPVQAPGSVRVATGQGKVREIQGQGKVREFCSGSGNFGILKKVREIEEMLRKLTFMKSRALV